MIVNPIMVVASPRSGTSLLQRILRECPDVWSLPSESNEIWDTYCHPSFRQWHSELMTADQLTPEARENIREMFESQVQSARFWRLFGRSDIIWSPKPSRRNRAILRKCFYSFAAISKRLRSMEKKRRILDKTASNSFRLGYVHAVFPDAKIIHVTRDGRNVVNSLINGWRNPTRFFSYDVPEELKIRGYDHQGWKFMLPPGWRDYTERPLEDVCAFQWIKCNEYILSELDQPYYKDRSIRIRLEKLAASPHEEVSRLFDFLKLPLTDNVERLLNDLPVINSPDSVASPDKWRDQHHDLVTNVLDQLAPMMDRLEYGS